MIKYKKTMFVLMMMLSGCVGSDEDVARFLVAPGKYDLYTCPEILKQMAVNNQRRRELEQLMAKANQEPSGQLVSALGYRPDYLTAQGELRDLREAAAAKNCDRTQVERTTAMPKM